MNVQISWTSCFPAFLAFLVSRQRLRSAKDVLKDLRRCDVELDTMAFSSFLKTLELDGNWRYSLQSLQENDQKQLPPDGLLYNALVSSCEKSRLEAAKKCWQLILVPH